MWSCNIFARFIDLCRTLNVWYTYIHSIQFCLFSLPTHTNTYRDWSPKFATDQLAFLRPFLAIFCQLHRYLSQNWGSDGSGLNLQGKSYSYHRVFPAICKYYRVSPQHTQSFPLKIKVHIFWEGHKILRNLHQLFVLCTASQIIGGDFAKFCGLLRIYEF